MQRSPAAGQLPSERIGVVTQPQYAPKRLARRDGEAGLTLSCCGMHRQRRVVRDVRQLARSRPAARRGRPLPDGAIRNPPEERKDKNAEQARHDYACHQMLAFGAGGVPLDELTNTDRTLAEDEVAHDGTNYG